ncbi:hypothetical protein NMG60_11031473 [Bertholletia excelsa]
MVSPGVDQEQSFPIFLGEGPRHDLFYNEIQFMSSLAHSGKLPNTLNAYELVNNAISADQDGLSSSLQNSSSSSSTSSSSSSSPPSILGNVNFKGTLIEESKLLQQQATTLEGFRVTQPLMAIDPTAVDSFKFPATLPVENSNFPAPELFCERPCLDGGGASANPGVMSLLLKVVTASSLDSQAGGADRKRSLAEEIMDKSMERRQKRMIKNRESAARSRARKQAYTNQLEHEVLQLRKRNAWLKKQKEVNKLLSSTSTTKPRYQLRRTSSAQF